MEWLGSIAEIFEGASHIAENFNSAYYDLIRRVAEFTAPIATILAGSFAIYQKLRFAERNLHLRLEEYLSREEKRLADADKRLDRATLRPGPALEFGAPLFTERTLRPVLRKMKWKTIRKAEDQLDDSIAELKKQLTLWEGQKLDYERKKFQAHLVSGAIASSRAAAIKAKGGDERSENLKALQEFEDALELDPDDLQAKEYVAHQRVRLADYEGAIADFEALATRARSQNNGLVFSRAMKFQAQVLAIQNTYTTLDQARRSVEEAISSLPEAYRGGIEDAELYEMLGDIQRMRERFTAATTAYTEAERRYNDSGNSEGIDGLKRVRAALQDIRLRPASNVIDLPNDSDIGQQAIIEADQKSV